MVRANKIPNSYELGLGEDNTMEGSTYAIGYLIPEAFSILLIPDTVIGKRFKTRSKTSSGISPD